MTDIRNKIREIVIESRLYKDFSTLTNQLLKNQNVEAIDFANKIISDEVEELAEQISQIIQK